MFSKSHFYIIKIKRNILTLIFLAFAGSLLLFSSSNLPAIKKGLSLWANSVVPSLFPFFVATDLLMHTNFVNILGRFLNKLMKPLFNIRGEGAFGFIMGLISGYPVGAKIACDFRENKKSSFNKNKNVTFSNLGEVLGKSITNSISTVLMIGGFVVIFSSIISILKSSGILNSLVYIFTTLFDFMHIDTSFIYGILTGLLEITNGISIISNIHIKAISINIVLTAFLLGFGGLSVLLQVLSITSKTDLSIKPYFYGKLLHGFLAGFYTFIFMNFFPFFNFNL